MSCITFTEGACNGTGKLWHIRNDDASRTYRATVKINRNNVLWATREYVVGPRQHQSLSLCSVGDGLYNAYVSSQSVV